MNESKKIFTVSLTGKQPFKAYAAFNGELLFIQKVLLIEGQYHIYRGPIIDEIVENANRGFAILIDEISDVFSRHGGVPFRFDETNPLVDDRINLYVALDWYFAMANMGTLRFADRLQQHALNESSFDRLQDEKGRLKYNVEWSRFTGAHRAVLLCVMAAAQDFLDERTIEAMTESMGLPDDKVYDPLASFRAITVGYDAARLEKWNEFDQKLLDEMREARKRKCRQP